jgi:hypothetical protein
LECVPFILVQLILHYHYTPNLRKLMFNSTLLFFNPSSMYFDPSASISFSATSQILIVQRSNSSKVKFSLRILVNGWTPDLPNRFPATIHPPQYLRRDFWEHCFSSNFPRWI